MPPTTAPVEELIDLARNFPAGTVEAEYALGEGAETDPAGIFTAWSAVGHATACYEAAVQYAAQRKQFCRPLAASQIVQERLARMQSELVTMQLMALHMIRRGETGDLAPAQASLAKFTCTRTARAIASNARDRLGGNGILLANRVARHLADIEAIHTYEGTETIQALIIGRSITRISAFA